MYISYTSTSFTSSINRILDSVRQAERLATRIVRLSFVSACWPQEMRADISEVTLCFQSMFSKPRLRIRSSILEERISTTSFLCLPRFHQTFVNWCNLGVYKETQPVHSGNYWTERNTQNREDTSLCSFLHCEADPQHVVPHRVPPEHGSPASLSPLFHLTMNMSSRASISTCCSWISIPALSAPLTEGDRYYQDQILLGNEVGQVPLHQPPRTSRIAISYPNLSRRINLCVFAFVQHHRSARDWGGLACNPSPIGSK